MYRGLHSHPEGAMAAKIFGKILRFGPFPLENSKIGYNLSNVSAIVRCHVVALVWLGMGRQQLSLFLSCFTAQSCTFAFAGVVFAASNRQ